MKTLFEYLNQKKYANALVISPDNEILLLRRANYLKNFRGLWCVPGGSVDDKDKTNIDACERELHEETGITLTWNEKHSIKEIKQIHDDNKTHYFFLIKLETKPDIKISREHAQYKWMDKKEFEDKRAIMKWIPNIPYIIQNYFDNEY